MLFHFYRRKPFSSFKWCEEEIDIEFAPEYWTGKGIQQSELKKSGKKIRKKNFIWFGSHAHTIELRTLFTLIEGKRKCVSSAFHSARTMHNHICSTGISGSFNWNCFRVRIQIVGGVNMSLFISYTRWVFTKKIFHVTSHTRTVHST